MPNKKIGIHGFSLVEMMVASGIMAVLALGFGQIMTMNSKIQNTAIRDQHINSIVDAASRVLGRDALCTCVMTQSPLSFAVPVSGSTAISGIPVRMFNQSCMPMQDVAVSTATRPPSGPWLRDVRLLNFAPGATPTEFLADVEFSFDKGTSTNVFGGQDVTRTIRGLALNTVISGSMARITSCGWGGSKKTLSGVWADATQDCTSSGSAYVSFPPGYFTQPPVVTLTAKWVRVTGNEDTTWWLNEITTAGFRIRWTGPGGGSCPNPETGVNWIAVEP